MAITVRAMDEPDRDVAFRIYADSYGAGPDTVASLANVSLDNRWVADDDGQVVALLRALPFAQCFGGRPVGSVGVAAVGVALEARSRGVSRAFMTGFLGHLRRAGVPLSTLYASTPAAYRPVGYEIAGSRLRYQLPLEHLPRSQPLPVEPWNTDDLGEVADCLDRIARANNGMMRRPDWWWEQRVFNVSESSYLYRYRVQEGGRTTGYLIYTNAYESRADLPVMWIPEDDATSVVTRDLFAETPTAAQSLLAFAAAQRALGKNLYWSGPPNDPMLSWLPDHFPTVVSSYPWLLRIVDVEGALTARGYAAHVVARAEVTIEDTVLPDNAGSYRIELSDGNCRVTRIDDATASLTVRGLSALYTSYQSASALVASGDLRAADDEAVAALTAIFSGPHPWMTEFF